MAFLDELSKKITQTSQDVVQKTKGATESMKLSSAISDEEKRIQSLYYEIGRRYFELHADSFEPAMEQLVLSIKESNTKIAAYNEQIKRIKGYVRCAICGAEVAYGAPFCSACGSKMMNENTAAPTAESNVRRCRQCGIPLAPGSSFCTNCGTQAAPNPAEAGIRRCRQCGNVLGEGMGFCTSCGTKAE